MTFEMTNHQWKDDHDDYKFYEWISADGASAGGGSEGWESTDLKTNGELTDTGHGAVFNKKVRFCYYKAPADASTALNTLDDVCDDGDINLDVGSANGEIVHDNQNEGARTAVADPSNEKEPTTASDRDHTVTSTQNIYLEKYVGIASTCASGGLDNSDNPGTALDGLGHGSDDIFAWGKIFAQDSFTLSITEVREETHTDTHSASGISITAEITTSPTTVNDFLFVSGEHSPAQTSLGDAFPNKQASSFDITYSTSWSGALSATTSTTCSSELTANAVSGNAHCYSDSADHNPPSSGGSAYGANNGCTAKLVSICTIDAPTLSDSIQYTSDNGHSMPEVGGDYAYTLGAMTTVEHNSAIVVAVRQYATRQYPLGYTPGVDNGLSAGATTGNAAAAQLIAQYETDIGEKTLGDKLGSVAVTNNEMSSDVFSCTLDVDGDCTDDPMYILGAVDAQQLAVVCSFNQAGAWDDTTPNTGDDGAPDAADVCTITDPYDIPSANSIPTTAHTSLHIQLPPASTPQFYVYGIATYQRADTPGSIVGGISAYSADDEQGSDSRRLRATKQVRKAFDQVTTSLDNAPITQVIDQIHYAVQM